MTNINDSDEHDIEPVSKSRMKREMHALQALGEKLVELSNEQIQQLNIPDALRDAVLQAKAIKKHGARRRQLQYVGRLMRDVDAGDLQQQYDNVTQHSAAAVAQLHQVEKWRTRLLEDEDQALQAFLQQYPDTDRQQLRQLIRTARQEHRNNKPPKAYRKLFHFIKELLVS
ncbi:MAG: ribosome biogenesis factor YjgA [Gammaproteobacteria bacterium]|jgi:ribosome-associated protein